MNMISFSAPKLRFNEVSDRWAARVLTWLLVVGGATLIFMSPMGSIITLGGLPVLWVGWHRAEQKTIREYENAIALQSHCSDLMMVDYEMIEWLEERMFDITLYRYFKPQLSPEVYFVEFHDATDEVLFFITFPEAGKRRFRDYR